MDKEGLIDIATKTTNKDIKIIQNAMNFQVRGRTMDLVEAMDYDVLNLPWIDDLRDKLPFKWKDNKLGEKDCEEWFLKDRLPMLVERKFVKEVKREEVKNIIPVFILKTTKVDGTIKYREILDFKVVNLAIKNVSAILPTYKEVVKLTKGATHFASIDLSNAYQRIIIANKDRSSLGMEIKGRYFVWNRLPFGLNIAPAVYQLYIQNLLKKVGCTLNYLDDILIWGKSAEEVKSNVEQVINILNNAYVEVNLDKSSMEPSENTDFLGYNLGAKGITNLEARKEKLIQNVNDCIDQAGLAKILGKLNFLKLNDEDNDDIFHLYELINTTDWSHNKNSPVKLNKDDKIRLINNIERKFKNNITNYETISHREILQSKAKNKTKDMIVYVDSSPYAAGIFIPERTSNNQFKIIFPRELQKYANKASLKELIGYYFASKLLDTDKRKIFIKGDNLGEITNISKLKKGLRRREFSHLQKRIEWIPNGNPILDVADAISRDNSDGSNHLGLEKDKERILNSHHIRSFKLLKEGAKITLKLKGREFSLNLDSLWNETIPAKVIKRMQMHKGAKKYLNMRKMIKEISKAQIGR